LGLPRIANFDDFDPLKAEPGVRVRYVASIHELGHPNAIIIPGTKSTIADLEWLRQSELAEAVTHFAQQSAAVVGICGGYQMLGETIYDSHHVESNADHISGLGLLPITTQFLKDKATYQVQAYIHGKDGWMSRLNDSVVSGYEIHSGETQTQSSWLEIIYRNGEQVKIADGSVSSDGKIWGCYLHGIFENDLFRHAWLESIGWQDHDRVSSQIESFTQSLDALADAVEGALNMELLEKIIWAD
ncbi:MAG: hypothetical protein MUO77_07575, partial [Anaerolineales bacterium]|nr:hypothetical protein [Anaerolineales bacterium]